MSIRVLGIKSGSFNDKVTGKLVEYCQLHVAAEDKNVTGEAVEVLKINQDLADSAKALKPGDKITVNYNKFGKVEDFKKIG